MAKSSTSFNEENRKKVKPRGKSKKTLIFNALREQSLLNLTPDDNNEKAEQAFINHWVNESLTPENPHAIMLFKELIARCYAAVKPTMEPVKFDYTPTNSASEKADQIINAIAEGAIPPDVGKMLLDAIKATVEIEEATELKDRIEAIEAAMNAASNPE